MSERAARIASLVAFLRRHHGEVSVRVFEHGQQIMDVLFPADLPPGLDNPCQRDIYLTLREYGNRLTTGQLLTEMERRARVYSEGWVKQNLSDLVESGVIDNSREPGPKGKGYGLPG